MSKGLETKQKLISAAIDLFAENGIQWVSFQQIGSKVGIAQPTLYKYFQDKDDLILACVQHVASTGRQLIDRNVDPLASASKQMRAYIEGNLLWVQKHPKEAIILFAIYYFAYNSLPLREILLSINEQSIKRLAVHIAAGEREGTWKQTDLPKISRIIHSLLIAEMFKAIHDPDEMNLRERTDFIWAAAEKVLKTS